MKDFSVTAVNGVNTYNKNSKKHLYLFYCRELLNATLKKYVASSVYDNQNCE